MRDDQRSKVYAAEFRLRHLMDNAVEFPTAEFYGSKVALTNDIKFGDLHGVQRYVDSVLGLNWVKSSYDRAQYKVTVRPRKGQGSAHYFPGEIAVPELGTRWAMREVVILHELAHHLTLGNKHNSDFVGCFAHLIEEIISPEMSWIYKVLINEHGAKIS